MRKEDHKMARKSLRIKLVSYDHRLIDESAKKIVEAAKKTEIGRAHV